MRGRRVIWSRNVVAATAAAVLSTGVLVSVAGPAGATVATVNPTLIQVIDTSAFSPSSPDPAGLSYVTGTDEFLVSDSEVEEMTIYAGVNLYRVDRTGNGTGIGTTVAFSKEPSGLGYHAASNTLYVADDDADRITVDRPGSDGQFGTADDVWYRFSTSAFGSSDAEGVEPDPVDGHLFVCDGVGLEVYEIDPVDAVFGDGDDVVTHFDIAQYGARDCEGIGIDAQRNLLLVVDPSRRKVYELSKSGVLQRIIDLAVLPVSGTNYAAAAVAPTSDPDDHPGALSMWLVDRHVDNGADPNENDGRLVEIAVPGLAPPADAFPTVTVTAPASGSTVKGSVAVAATAADDLGVTQVEFSVDGTPIGTDTTGADGWTTTWDAAALDGSHTVTVVATDTIGQTGSDSNVVTVDNTAPSVAITAPTDGAGVEGVVAVAVSANDDHAVATVEVRVDGTTIGTDTDGTDGWSVLWDTTSVSSGQHVLTATATDGAGTSTISAPVTVSVTHPTVVSFDRAVSVGSDDADEIPNGSVRRSNGDFELGSEQNGQPTIGGLRFTGISIPAGATIVRAHVQFTADEKDRRAASIEVHGQAADDPSTFLSSAFDISSRARTVTSALWNPPTWLEFGEASESQRTSDLSAVLQEIIDRPGWNAGNALVLLFRGTGRRTAETFEGGFAPVLHVEYAVS